MDITKWNLEDAKVVWREEALEEGREERGMEIARKLLKRNRPIDEIVEDTGLDMETIKSLR